MARFRTRARALDLLGRQQIASIPTALNELIKNAHDAYADNFSADLIRKEELLVIRDDGIGMTRADFENRWLTLGTESKSVENSEEIPRDPAKQPRNIMGAKGIGRLAIASIGNQVLILTKSKLVPESQIVACFINWSVFELPFINLEDIVIPVEEYDHIPTKSEIHKLCDESRKSLISLLDKYKTWNADFDRILKRIEDFSVDPIVLAASLPGNFSLDTSSGGTWFFISPVSETLYIDAEREKDSDEASKLEKMLAGFHNTMIPGHPKPDIDIAFRDFRGSDFSSFTSLIQEDSFFTVEDFNMADHHFSGDFDSFGQFRGMIRIYGEKTYDHVINWNGNRNRPTECGPFRINIAYLQGEQKSSRVDPVDYARIKAKGDFFGGLYIYRNNIRILPYGNSDYDFLDIEKNRSKRASTYFFSYRRMFGAVEIDNVQNRNLVEKAGREGFIENKAYKQLQAILKNFFVQLAADFFSSSNDSPYSDFYQKKKTELNKMYAALERREKQAKSKKEYFSKSLDLFFDRLSKSEFQSSVKTIIDRFNQELQVIYGIENDDEAGQRLITLENDTNKTLQEYKKSIEVQPPRGFSPTKAMIQDYDLYQNEIQVLDINLFDKARSEIAEKISIVTQQRNLSVDKKKRLENAVEQISSDVLKSNKKLKYETDEIVKQTSAKVREVTSELIQDLDQQIRQVKEQFSRIPSVSAGTFDLVQERKRLESEIDEVSNRNKDLMESIIKQFESFYIERNSEGEYITNAQVADAMSAELDDMRTRLMSDVELSQLGLAVGILNHEFYAVANSIKQGLKDLKRWADIESKMEGIYTNLKINFDHLDGYLSLLTPMSKRLNRKREDIPLRDINLFLIDLFKARMDRHNISLKHTFGFEKGSLYGFRSTFYPVFVNVVDNAIYWLSNSNVENKIIRLHADDNGIYISNNGDPVRMQDRERIFEMLFTRKPNGRGMGLSISREVLEAEGYNLILDIPQPKMTVTFKISKIKREDNDIQ